MDPIILTAVIASGVVFLFVLAWKLAWFVNKMSEDTASRGVESANAGGESIREGTGRAEVRKTGEEKAAAD